MNNHNRVRTLLLVLLSPILAAPQSFAFPRPINRRSTRALQSTTTDVVPGNPGSSSDSLASEGEQCNNGGSIMPKSCQPGLICKPDSVSPAPGRPGWHPDYAMLGTCVNSTNATLLLVKEGGNCTAIGNNSTGDCEGGLYCDTTSSMVPPGTPAIPETSMKGLCQKMASHGDLCYAGGVMVMPAEEEEPVSTKLSTPIPDLAWTAPCSGDLVCFILDPSPVANDSIPIQNKLASFDMSTKFLGYCLNRTEVPAPDSRKGSGTQSGVCKVGVPLSRAANPCQVGLTCITSSSVLETSTPGAVTYGVCADPAQVLNQPEIVPLSSGANATAQSSAPSSKDSSNATSPSFASTPKSALQVLHRYWVMTFVGLVFGSMLS